MFGGSQGNELFITSAAIGASDSENHTNEEGEFLGGPLYKLQTTVMGRDEWYANL